MKKIEKLYLKDLKNTFDLYLTRNLLTKPQRKVEWRKFWADLKKKCSVVETI